MVTNACTYLAVNFNTVIIIAPLFGFKGHDHVKTESWYETAPLLGILDGEKGCGRWNDVHLLVVLRCVDDLLERKQ